MNEKIFLAKFERLRRGEEKQQEKRTTAKAVQMETFFDVENTVAEVMAVKGTNKSNIRVTVLTQCDMKNANGKKCHCAM